MFDVQAAPIYHTPYTMSDRTPAVDDSVTKESEPTATVQHMLLLG